MRNFSIFTLLAALLFVGCSDVFVELESPLANETTLPDLTANFADDGLTRTYVEEGKYLRWHEADLITAFYGNTLNRQYKFKGKTGDNSGTFSLIPSGELGTGNNLDAIYALYPYDENATITDEGVISLTLPSEQSYAENSFGKGANTMIAVTENIEDTFLSFKNACGYLKLNLYNVDGASLKSLTVKGNNDEKIAGAATATIEFGSVPTVVMGNDATTTVTLDCGEGIALDTSAEEATALWIVLPETTFENGITISATDTKGGVFEKSTSNVVAITRNDIQPMTALGVEFVPAEVKPANNEIWYTNGSTTVATTLYKTDVFGANILSNTYDAEKECWVIKFDGEVTTIGNYAFNRRNTISSITIPDSVNSIGNGAFANCSGITSFTIPDGVTSIGNEAFYNTGIKSITIPDSVNSIGYGAFYGCPNLEKFEGKFATNDGYCLIEDGELISFAAASDVTEYTIPDSVTTIGNNAFYGCTNLISVNIPESVNSIENSAFSGCQNLKSVTIPQGKGIFSMGSFVFYNCRSLTEIYCKNPALTIESDFFDYHADDFKIYVPSSSVIRYRTTENWVEYVDYIVGYNFNTGEIVDIPTKPADNEIWYLGNSIPSIGLSIEFNADLGCMVMTCPGLIIDIPERLFYNMDFLTAVILPDCVTSIGNEAFAGCTSLMSIVIPDSVTTLGSGVFSNCTELSSVTFGKKLTEIPSSAFFNCSSLSGRNMVIPEGITSIGNGAFAYSVKTVTLPSSLRYIANGAFAGINVVDCSAIATPPQIESEAFIGNSNLIIVVPAASLNAYKSAWGMYAPYIRC
ncbi:MAG: leucine-rich repeat domain-containing protein [Alistipes sp.]|nr:leucine-rich repeat domain-containing protein [Alistipes sp.]